MNNFYELWLDRIIKKEDTMSEIESEILYSYLLEELECNENVTVAEFIEFYRQTSLEIEGRCEREMQRELRFVWGY